MTNIIYENLIKELFETNNHGESTHDIALRIFESKPEISDIIKHQKDKGFAEYGVYLNEESKIKNIINGKKETVTFENLKYEILMELVDALVYSLLRHKLLANDSWFPNNDKSDSEKVADLRNKSDDIMTEIGKFKKLIDLILEF